MNEPRTRVKKRKKKNRFLRLLLVVILFCFVGAASYAGYLAYKVKSAADKTYHGLSRKSDLRTEKVTLGENPVTILLLGIEKYSGDEPPHSDSMMLITLNPKTKETAILSIPRDTRTFLPVINQESKITHAYSYGNKKGGQKAAVEASMEAVEKFLDVPIDYYATVNFKAFKEVVDDLGGVTVKVKVAKPITQRSMKAVGGKTYTFIPGETRHMNGAEALTYVQMRKTDPEGDFGRQKRQQQILQALADKALSVTTVTKATDLLDTVGNNITTNITLKEMFGMRNFYSSIKDGKHMEHFVFTHSPETDVYLPATGPGRTYYFVPKQEEVQKISNRLKEILEINQ